MACALLLYGMTPDTQLDGTMLAKGPLHDSKVAQRIKEATEESDAVFLILEHPTMRLGGVRLSGLHRATAKARGREGGEPRRRQEEEEGEG